ncbi:hypothetical protein JQ616_28205 [Bradyrhizobium tropiciagri]|uniref:hypothetical protein n=1 Tax=Bradyrhizobium tropiciagri TaxID=312253 RepID=UPI001BA48333|nr:hypothetical protein [Bradyrhizobium tropiciagri]MBR0898860.1 hypothetical protein [Bradyrhizobium tropiciagri]
MQTIRIPYTTDAAGRDLIASLRRVQSAAIRSAYANAMAPDGSLVVEKDVRALVKARFGTAVLDSWALHCAARLGRAKRKNHPDGKVVFGGRSQLERRRKGLITEAEWKSKRLLPFVSYGDRQKVRGNQNVHLRDPRTLRLKIGRFRSGRRGKLTVDMADLHLAQLTGNAGQIISQVAAKCAKPEQRDRINVSYSIDDKFVSITFDPQDLPDHPERRAPVAAIAGRAVGIDLNPSWIGITVAENMTDQSQLGETEALDWALIKLEHAPNAPAEVVREVLAAAADRAIGLARKWGAATIAIEKGLGKLRSGGKSRKLNQLLNYWARTLFVAMLRRKAGLAGIKVVEVWGGYSTTIGNLRFELPDACAAAAEIARRGFTGRAKLKDVLPAFDEGWRARLRKDVPLPAEAESWADVHRGLKAAKTIGYRRPHPDMCPDPGGRTSGIAVRRLGRRRRPGLLARPVGTGRPQHVSSEKREMDLESTRKSG